VIVDRDDGITLSICESANDNWIAWGGNLFSGPTTTSDVADRVIRKSFDVYPVFACRADARYFNPFP